MYRKLCDTFHFPRYMVSEERDGPLMLMDMRDFVLSVGARSASPGGGSVAAFTAPMVSVCGGQISVSRWGVGCCLHGYNGKCLLGQVTMPWCGVHQNAIKSMKNTNFLLNPCFQCTTLGKTHDSNITDCNVDSPTY